MKSLGLTIFALGVLSCLLHFFDREFIVLAWIGLWGPKMAWVIRGVLIVGGLILGTMGVMQEEDIGEE